MRASLWAFADGLVILVHAESGQVHGLAVDEEAGAVDTDSSDAEDLLVSIDYLITVD